MQADGSTRFNYYYARNKYNIKFVSEGETVSEGSYTYGTQMPTPSVYRPGYEFAGWEPEVSYTVPANIIQKIRLSGLRFTVTGNNLHYFTKYSGLNPEEGGQDNGRYAMPRNIIFSANVSF